MEARFFKKATGKIVFKCLDGDLINRTVQNAVASGEGQEVIIESNGYNAQGALVAHFKFTWSFKKRTG